jgi:hypothetical protein
VRALGLRDLIKAAGGRATARRAAYASIDAIDEAEKTSPRLLR